jgi:hypothetical protein
MRHSLIQLVLFVGLLPLSCEAPAPKGYVTPEVRFNKKSAEMGTPVEVNYSFGASSDFPGFRKDLTVFVHFLDPQGTIQFVDDHVPPVRTNQWASSQKYGYTRMMLESF